MRNSKIAWTDHTFNPWVGCSPVSEGCAHCYARDMAERWKGSGAFAVRTRTSEAYWRQPLAWDRAAERSGRRVRVFCGSMCDWLDAEVPAQWLEDLLELVLRTPHIDWLMLTKRPENFWSRVAGEKAVAQQFDLKRAFLPYNVWFGVTAENQERWNERVTALSKIPARVRWVSAEPLLGPVLPRAPDWRTVDWVVAGGENGRAARACETMWVMRLCERVKCDMGKAFFFKQWGKRPVVGGVKWEATEWWEEWERKNRRWPE